MACSIMEPVPHCLSSLSTCDVDEVRQAIFSPEFITNANMLVMIAGTFAATQTKYGPRGYRYILIEAGHAAQNLCLTATELGYATLCLGGFDDHRLNRALCLHELEEGVLELYCSRLSRSLSSSDGSRMGRSGADTSFRTLVLR